LKGVAVYAYGNKYNEGNGNVGKASTMARSGRTGRIKRMYSTKYAAMRRRIQATKCGHQTTNITE